MTPRCHLHEEIVMKQKKAMPKFVTGESSASASILKIARQQEHAVKITVMGSDYSGLVIGAYAAELGNQVICHDSDTDRVQSLRRCKVPACDPELLSMMARNKGAGRLTFTHDAIQSITHGEIIFITQGIDIHGWRAPDCSHVSRTVKNINRWGKRCKLVLVFPSQLLTAERYAPTTNVISHLNAALLHLSAPMDHPLNR
jgi:UDP-N-acetyl-D-mannosaminuronate dehydrogenase